jgi:DNA replication protein DnaC
MKSLAEIISGIDFEAAADRVDPRLDRLAERAEIRGQLPAMLQERSWKGLRSRVKDLRLLRAVDTWQPGSGSLLMMGPTDLGKTSAAGILFRRLLGEGVQQGGDAWELARSMRWYAATDLELCRREHALGRGDAPEVIAACHARLLFIDDAGWDRDPKTIADVLNARYERKWPTIVTTHKTRVELGAHYGAALVRRLLDAGGLKSTVVDLFARAA